MICVAVSHTIKIAGTDITSYVQDGFTEDSLLLNISKAELTISKTVDSVLTLSANQSVEIWRDYDGSVTSSDYIFQGTVELIGISDYTYNLTCFDKLDMTKKRQVSRVFLSTDAEAGKLSEIAKTLFNNYTTLTADGTTMQDSGTTTILTKFVCRNAYIFERLKKLSEILNWYFYYEPISDKAYFEPLRYTTNANQLNTSNFGDLPIWEEDKTELVNSVTMIGSNVVTETTELFDGTGGLDSFTLAHKPVSAKVYDSTNLKTGGQQGTSGIDYYVDLEAKKITFVTNTTAGSDNIEIRYSYESPLPMQSENAVSIATYGKFEAVITIMDVVNSDDLRNRISNYLNTYSTPFKIFKAKVSNITNYSYKRGQKVEINDTLNDKPVQSMVIRKIKKNLRQLYDSIECGDKEFRVESYLAYALEYRIKKLEEEQIRETGFVFNLVQNTHQLTPSRISITRTLTRINDSFVLGHDTNGVLNRGKFLDDFEVDSTTNWAGSSCTLAEETTTKLVGAKSLKITSSAGTFNISTTQSFGDLSTYTGVGSGAPTSGIVGLWINVAATNAITSTTLRIGSNSSNYTEIAGVKTYTDAFGLETGWNYFVFRLKNGATTGTPNWASVAYERFAFASASTPVIYADYNTIGKGNLIGVNGLGDRRTQYTVTTTTY